MLKQVQRRKKRFFPFARKPKKIEHARAKSFTLYDPASFSAVNRAFTTFRARVNHTARKRKPFN